MLQTSSLTSCPALLCGDVFDSDDFDRDRHYDEDAGVKIDDDNDPLCNYKVCTDTSWGLGFRGCSFWLGEATPTSCLMQCKKRFRVVNSCEMNLPVVGPKNALRHF